LQGRRIVVSLVIAVAVGGAAAVLSPRAIPAAHRSRSVRIDRDALDMRDLPVPVPLPRRAFHGPALRTPVPVLM
jgi:hypothetical protein